MSDHKQGTELDSLMATGIPASGTQGAGLQQTPLIEGLENDVEKTSGAMHTCTAPKITVSAASPGPGVPVDAAVDKKPGFFGKLKQTIQAQLKKPVVFWNKTDKRTMLTASSCFLTVMMLCAMISLAVVAVHGSKVAPAVASVARAVQLFYVPAPVIHSITIEKRNRFSSYLDGGSTVLPLTSTIGDTCDDEAGSVAVPSQSAAITTTTSLLATLMLSASVMPVSVDVLTLAHPSVAPFLATSSAAAAAISPMSMPTHSSQTCLEYGDGAGPCARPYGRPNSTPESWISSLAAESLVDTTTLAAGVSASVLPIGIPAMGSSSIDASLCQPTATVYVTITAGSEPDHDGNLTALDGSSGGGGTVFATSTSLSVLTVTWSGSGGPLTTTETVFGVSGGGANGTGGVTALNVPNYTLTMQTTVGANGTAFSSAGPTALGPVVSSGGGEQLTAPKPLSMGGSVSGNGVYCVVMLAALVALLM